MKINHSLENLPNNIQNKNFIEYSYGSQNDYLFEKCNSMKPGDSLYFVSDHVISVFMLTSLEFKINNEKKSFEMGKNRYNAFFLKPVDKINGYKFEVICKNINSLTNEEKERLKNFNKKFSFNS